MIRSISERENGSDAVGRLFTSWPQSRAINIMQQDGLGVLCVTRENSRGETRANNRLYFRQPLDHSHHTSSKCFLLFCREKGKELTPPPPPPPLSRRLRPGRKDFLQKEGENSWKLFSFQIGCLFWWRVHLSWSSLPDVSPSLANFSSVVLDLSHSRGDWPPNPTGGHKCTNTSWFAAGHSIEYVWRNFTAKPAYLHTEPSELFLCQLNRDKIAGAPTATTIGLFRQQFELWRQVCW